MSQQEQDARRRVSSVIGIVSHSSSDKLLEGIQKAEQASKAGTPSERFRQYSIYLLLVAFSETDYQLFRHEIQQLNGNGTPVLHQFADWVEYGFVSQSQNTRLV